MLFFTYGTLQTGRSAHSFLSRHNAQSLGQIKTDPHYHLYDVGFPGMVLEEKPGVGVTGELFEAPEAAFPDMDRYEGISHGLFKKEKVTLEDGREATAYIFNRLDRKRHPKIDSGIWNQ